MPVPSNCFLLIKNSAYASPLFKRQNNVYYDEEIIPEADVKSFILMDNNFGKDAKMPIIKPTAKRCRCTKLQKEGDFIKTNLVINLAP